ncbi:MAG: hypothetical protein WCV82_02415 [Candidatus Paceibacterota bacterium]
MTSIAIILPDKSKDYIANSVLDGFRALEHTGDYFVRISPRFIPIADYADWELEEGAFIEFAKKADLILYIHAKYTSRELVDKIGLWDKTITIDGHEVGKDNRYDFTIQKGLLDGTFKSGGSIQQDLLAKCRRYFRRERPYIDGIIPFPFAIEKRFMKYVPGQKKDIDFTCIFGQDEHPLMRRYATEMLESYCAKNGFTCMTAKTNHILLNRDFRNTKSQAKFHDILARTKVGVSVGGSGFDTLRFWEILANNCVLLTESIDIYDLGSDALKFKRIFEFKNLFEFKYQLEELGKLIKSGRIDDYLGQGEYTAILDKHLSGPRVRELVRISLQPK